MRYRILIVDDHPLFRDALQGAVAQACPDCELTEADSVATLFEALEQHTQTDLLLLDLNLPGAYGFCTLAHLRGSRPELPVIVVSAMDDAKTVRRALALGARGQRCAVNTCIRPGCDWIGMSRRMAPRSIWQIVWHN
jgi:DNA-binding NarL/FixJ family response regulator